MQEITNEKEYNESQIYKHVVYYFTASWCGPCKKILPEVLKWMERCDYFKVYKIDIEKMPSLAETYKVSSVPTFFFIYCGETINTFSGADSENLKYGFYLLDTFESQELTSII